MIGLEIEPDIQDIATLRNRSFHAAAIVLGRYFEYAAAARLVRREATEVICRR